MGLHRVHRASADRIVILRSGCIEQVGKPLELYDKPKTKFVGGFIGSPSMNFIRAEVLDYKTEKLTLKLFNYNQIKLELLFKPKKEIKIGQVVELGIRPEHIVLDSKNLNLTVKIEFIEHLGACSFAYASSKEESLVFELRNNRNLKQGDEVTLSFLEGKSHIFDLDGKSLSY